jgi:hypothetical protein
MASPDIPIFFISSFQKVAYELSILAGLADILNVTAKFTDADTHEWNGTVSVKKGRRVKISLLSHRRGSRP